jgi:hypothetical protein
MKLRCTEFEDAFNINACLGLDVGMEVTAIEKGFMIEVGTGVQLTCSKCAYLLALPLMQVGRCGIRKVQPSGY